MTLFPVESRRTYLYLACRLDARVELGEETGNLWTSRLAIALAALKKEVDTHVGAIYKCIVENSEGANARENEVFEDLSREGVGTDDEKVGLFERSLAG